ncbi:uncharacterized protein PG998_013167 [Apiospora kogelbergensis]|uniref:uncharacterized protein n=1 Tax=Apiospora kogelbergensis TaxID=1337665 RepID=UPI0031305CB0
MSSTGIRHSRSPPTETKATNDVSSGLPADYTNLECADPPANSDLQDGSIHSGSEESLHEPPRLTRSYKGQTSKSTSLWCSKTGLSHGSLQQWHITACPACKQHLRSPRAENGDMNRGRRRASQPSTAPDFAPLSEDQRGFLGFHVPRRDSSRASRSTWGSSRSNSRSPQPGPHGAKVSSGDPTGTLPVSVLPRIYGTDPYVPFTTMPSPGNEPGSLDVGYSITFLSAQGEKIGDRPYHERLDIQKERDAIVSNTDAFFNNKDPIIQIMTLVQTNIKEPSQVQRTAIPHWERTMREGILRNPKYSVEVKSECIKILSYRIIKRLKEVVTYYPAMNLMEDEVTLKEPYAFVFHCMDIFKSHQQDNTVPANTNVGAESYCDEETRRHLKVLFDAVEVKQGADVERELARYAAPVPKATFKMLWLLFRPGSTVYTRLLGGWQACVVTEVKFNYPKVSKLSGSYLLSLWYLNFDGSLLGRCKVVREITPFDGEADIVSLGAFPAKYLDAVDGGRMRKKLESRGERYYRYLKGTQVHYSGETLGDEARQYTGPAIIDISAYFRYGTAQGYYTNRMLAKPTIGFINDHVFDKEIDDMYDPRPPHLRHGARRQMPRMPMQGPPGAPMGPSHSYDDDEDASRAQDLNEDSSFSFPFSAYDDIDPKKTSSLDLQDRRMGQSERHRYLLCPNMVIGFMLKSRNWDLLDIDCCHAPRNNRDAIDTLVISKKRKVMIKALVYRYTDQALEGNNSSVPWAADFIENKGEGQIFLLHGSPGVECIAESTGRPLLSITCGDIGTDEEDLERRLSKWFRLAERWGAVMLLDEADVFLERRATSDLHRNSLVTVFLRAMEYYRGILFLTTNRVGHFDDAFISRIHVVLRYDNLTNEDRETIWTQFFEKLKKERGKFIEISREAKKYVLKDPEMTSIPWNGREIRNTFQTAVALAEYRFVHREYQEDGEKACLDWEDFENVCRMTGAFKGYLQSVHHGDDEAQRARNELARNDAFVEPKGDVT